MRDENKSDYWVARPVYRTDAYNATSILGYSPLLYYRDLVHEGPLDTDNEKFGNRDTETVRIAHDNNDGVMPDIKPDDGVWLEEPTLGLHEEYYQRPPFLVETIQHFGRKNVYVLKRTVEQR